MNVKQLKVTIDALVNEGFGTTEVIGMLKPNGTHPATTCSVSMYHDMVRNDGKTAGVLLNRDKGHLYIPLHLSH
jgi:hypothetical protein